MNLPESRPLHSPDAGKAQTLRNQTRTERLLNSLPAHLRKDIGWPDRFGGHTW